MAAQAWHEEHEGSRNHQRPARGEALGGWQERRWLREQGAVFTEYFVSINSHSFLACWLGTSLSQKGPLAHPSPRAQRSGRGQQRESKVPGGRRPSPSFWASRVNITLCITAGGAGKRTGCSPAHCQRFICPAVPAGHSSIGSYPAPSLICAHLDRCRRAASTSGKAGSPSPSYTPG